MTFKAKSSRLHQFFWGSMIIIICLFAFLFNWSLNFSLLLLSLPVLIFIAGQMIIPMRKYAVNGNKFEIHYRSISKIKGVPLDSLTVVHPIKIRWKKQLLMGYPPNGIEVFFKNHGHYILLTDEEKLKEILDDHLTKNNMAEFPQIAASLPS